LSAASEWHLFDVFGVEMEYMIVDRRTLEIRSFADHLLREMAGDYVQSFERGDFAWSNELVCHVIELKTNGPAPRLGGLAGGFLREINFINMRLDGSGAMLLGTGAHPLMNPDLEIRLWPHGDRAIYRQYDRVFDCRGHGWSNLQSVHLNLPFVGDEEFGRLHAAIRLVLPIIPALAASTPILNGEVTGYMDTRLETYRHNQDRIPSITGRVIPEQVFTESEYKRIIFDEIERDIRPHDPDGVLEPVFLNSRGAIGRFDRQAIEIRVIDTQECPSADMAVLDMIIAAVRMLVEEATVPLASQQAWPEDLLADIFLDVVRDGDQAILVDREYLEVFGLGKGRMSAIAVWRELANRLSGSLESASRRPLARVLSDGPLARRLIGSLGRRPGRLEISHTYRQLGDCLAQDRLWP